MKKEIIYNVEPFINELIKFDIVSYENNNCTDLEVEQLLEIFKRKFISWVSSPSVKYRYELDDIAFNLRRPRFTLLIEREPENDSDTKNLDYYLGTFENEENGKTLLVKAILSYL